MNSVSESGQSSKDQPGEYRTVSARQILLHVLWRLAQMNKGVLAHRLWLGAKAATFSHVSIDDLPGVGDARVEGWPTRLDAFILAALASQLQCESFFEFGTFRGRTTWTVVHNNPKIKAFSLDLAGPDSLGDARLELTDPHLFESWRRGEAVIGTPESERVTLLTGDSARFDYRPYQNQMDLVYIDGSHSYSYVRSDTEAALEMLSARGTIVWDDFYYPGVWKYLNEIKRSLPLFLISSTGMIVHSRHPDLADIHNARKDRMRADSHIDVAPKKPTGV
jgi:hypothetical protein